MAKNDSGRSLVGNASDKGQVRKAEELEGFARERRLNGWRYLLATPLGRELAWSLLEDCHVFSTIMAQSPYVFENAGRHDWGLKMMAEMILADEDSYLVMQKEAMERGRRAPTPERKKPDDTGESTDG